MRTIIALLILFGILISGCVTSPTKDIPVVKVNITFVEKNGSVEVEDYTITQGTVQYFKRPTRYAAESFPSISGRTVIVRSNITNVSWIGPWENEPYKGSGTYSFNLGFSEEHYPKRGDTVHVSIMVINETAERVGYVRTPDGSAILLTWTEQSIS
jgi:hypothetical protein